MRATIASGMIVPNRCLRIHAAERAERSGLTPIRMANTRPASPASASRADIAAHHAGIHAELGLHELAPAATLALRVSGCHPGGGSMGMSAAPMKNSAAPATLAPWGSLPSSRMARAVSVRARGIEVEHRLGVRLVAGAWVVAPQQQQVADAERGGAHQLALQGDAVAVAAGELEDRLDPGPDQQGRRGRARPYGRARRRHRSR